ncbi:hypothetical protein PGB90_001836 [Kerria lacca]
MASVTLNQELDSSFIISLRLLHSSDPDAEEQLCQLWKQSVIEKYGSERTPTSILHKITIPVGLKRENQEDIEEFRSEFKKSKLDNSPSQKLSSESSQNDMSLLKYTPDDIDTNNSNSDDSDYNDSPLEILNVNGVCMKCKNSTSSTNNKLDKTKSSTNSSSNTLKTTISTKNIQIGAKNSKSYGSGSKLSNSSSSSKSSVESGSKETSNTSTVQEKKGHFMKKRPFEHTKVFAYAIGYRVNFDLRKSKKSKLYMDQNVINSYFQPEQIRKTTEILFNLYGWNGTACIVRSLCEIYQIPHQPTDLFGPIMKLLFFGTEYPYVKKQFCEDGARCTVIQLVYCYLMSALGTEGIFTVGVTLGTNWDVPVDLDKLMYDEHKKIMANRRDRRSLYPKIEYILNQLGMDGKLYVKKLLCDSRKKFSTENKHLSFIEEIIRTVFSYPTLPKIISGPIDEYDYMLFQCSQPLGDGYLR